jgi:predicted RNA-binding Zn ribbon-like protein
MQVSLDDYQFGAAVATALANSGPEVRVKGDQIPDADALGRFLAEHGLPFEGRGLGTADVTRAHALRSALRAAIAASTPAEVADRAGELASTVGTGPLLVADADGRWRWQARTGAGATPVDELALLTATAVLAVLRTLGPDRFRHCASPDCQGVFLDTSRGGRRRYCEPEVCGNRVNVAAYRARRRAEGVRSG